MVYRIKAKKGGKPDQKAQGKKPAPKGPVKDMSSILYEDDDNMDSDNSSDAVVTKTPKGKQTPNEKRVSFQVPGKNTPAKTPVGKKQATPAKQNSVSKKQATPGKADLNKFKGMAKQGNKKSLEPEDDDDDDDDDEDDEDDDAEVGFAKFDMDMGSDEDEDDDDLDEDDDDDDDDDDEDEEDEDSDEDEEEEEINQKKLTGKNQKQNVVQPKQTPVKGNEKQNAQTPKNIQTPKSKESQSPKSAKKDKSAEASKQNLVWTTEEERRKARDVTQLYLGSLPKEVTDEDLKTLSSDIISVNLVKRHNMNKVFAFLQFASEAKAEENLHIIKAKTLKGATLNVDFVGAKSSHKTKDSKVQYNPKKLYVTGLPTNVTIHQISKFFPKCHSVSFNQSPVFRAATVMYWSEEDANAAFEETKDIKLGGASISVLHSLMGKKTNKRKRNANKKNKMNNGSPAKKMKQEESEDEE